MALLQKVFQLRTCENTVFANRSRPCMLHQIERCSAPCVGLVTAADYADDVQGAVLFLQGKTTEVLAQLKAQMDEASAALEFERAARIRDKITRLTGLQSRQFVESATAGDIDVVAAAAAEGQVAVNVVMVRGGRHVGDRSYFPRHADAGALAEVVPAFLAQHYVGRPVPPTIIAAGADEEAALADVLSAQAGQRVQIVGNPGGERRVWLAMAMQNAEFAIRQKLAQKATQEDRLAALQKALGLPAEAQRIECFDVSHTMGERAVASCVIFDRLAMQTAEYRRFNVTPPAGGDDYAAMREALTRRCARIVAGEFPAPDLLVVDGGKGQVAVAAEVLAEQGLHDTRLIGIAKGPERKAGEEDIVFPDRDAVLNLPADHPGLHLLQQIRDEAHRFAIQGHRARRGKARTTSSLQEIAGIGAKKRQALLAHFGGLKGVQAASVDDLARVPGVSRALRREDLRPNDTDHRRCHAHGSAIDRPRRAGDGRELGHRPRDRARARRRRRAARHHRTAAREPGGSLAADRRGRRQPPPPSIVHDALEAHPEAVAREADGGARHGRDPGEQRRRQPRLHAPRRRVAVGRGARRSTSRATASSPIG